MIKLCSAIELSWLVCTVDSLAQSISLPDKSCPAVTAVAMSTTSTALFNERKAIYGCSLDDSGRGRVCNKS